VGRDGNPIAAREQNMEEVMKNSIRTQVVLAVVISMASAVGFAQSGEATYKAKCATCHGATGTPSAGMAKMMGIKAASDPDIQKLTVDQMACCEGRQGQDEAHRRSHRRADQGSCGLLQGPQVTGRKFS
jgi:mono/diheme cytochrome c family protein